MKVMKIIINPKMYGSDEGYCELTQIMDKYIIHSFGDFKTYLYDPEYYLQKNANGKYVKRFLDDETEVDSISVPIRYPGATRGHIKVDLDGIIEDIQLYDDTCFGAGRLEPLYKRAVLEELKKYIGYKVEIVKIQK